jgi:predicted transposase YdaD
MSRDFDPTLKTLVETAPADWLPLVGRPPAPVTVLDADIATVVSGAMDKLLRVGAEPEYLLHLDFQAGHDSARLPPRLRLYDAAQAHRHGLRVLSTAVLLHPGADSPQVTGVYEEALPGEEPYAVFRYKVIRVWQASAEQFLTGGLCTLPLAPISSVSGADLPRVIRRMQERLRQEGRANDLWAATKILLGLRHPPDLVNTLLRGVIGMKESSTYQEILAEGRAERQVEEARRILLKLGKKHLGPPDPATRTVLDTITDVEQFERLVEGVFTAGNWQELLGPRRRERRKSDR